MAQTRRLATEADALLVVVDASLPATRSVDWLEQLPRSAVGPIALNKADLCDSAAMNQIRSGLPPSWRPCAVPVSASEGSGLGELVSALLTRFGRERARLNSPAAYTPRQVGLFRKIMGVEDLATARKLLAAVVGVG